MIHWKLDCRIWMQTPKNKTNHKAQIRAFWLVNSSNNDHKRQRHYRNRSWILLLTLAVGLIFTRSYHSVFLIKTRTPTPSPVKGSLSESESMRDMQLFLKKSIVRAFADLNGGRNNRPTCNVCSVEETWFVLRTIPERLIKLLETVFPELKALMLQL